jgi:hypothetical protein
MRLLLSLLCNFTDKKNSQTYNGTAHFLVCH